MTHPSPRRRLGVPGAARPDEYLPPAYPADGSGPADADERADGTEPIGAAESVEAAGPAEAVECVDATRPAEGPGPGDGFAVGVGADEAAGSGGRVAAREARAVERCPEGRGGLLPAPGAEGGMPAGWDGANVAPGAPSVPAPARPVGAGGGGAASEEPEVSEAAPPAVPAGRAPVDGVPDAGALRGALEAILLVVDEPIGEERLAGVLEVPRADVRRTLGELAEEYAAQGRGFDLRFVAGGWRFYTRTEFSAAVDRFVLDGQQARLTQAALETLAVVGYRQPVSRARVSAVRGVNCDGVMRTLVQRGLVEEAGSESETGAILYRTTNYFLERMGLRGLDELPELAPFLPEAEDVEADSQEGSAIAEAVAAVSTDSGTRDDDGNSHA
jgi:segregation and condensation protein B